MAKKSLYKTTNEKFEKDLSFGEMGEQEMSKFFEKKGLMYLGSSRCLFPDDTYKYGDLVFMNKEKKQFLIEVKTDEYVRTNNDTGNIVIEISCNSKPSGLKTTKSKIWVNYFINLLTDNVWYIKVDDLKQLIDKNSFHITSGGDCNAVRMVQIPRNQFRTYFKVETWSSGKVIKTDKKVSPYIVEYFADHKKNYENPFD